MTTLTSVRMEAAIFDYSEDKRNRFLQTWQITDQHGVIFHKFVISNNNSLIAVSYRSYCCNMICNFRVLFWRFKKEMFMNLVSWQSTRKCNKVQEYLSSVESIWWFKWDRLSSQFLGIYGIWWFCQINTICIFTSFRIGLFFMRVRKIAKRDY